MTEIQVYIKNGRTSEKEGIRKGKNKCMHFLFLIV